MNTKLLIGIVVALLLGLGVWYYTSTGRISLDRVGGGLGMPVPGSNVPDSSVGQDKSGFTDIDNLIRDAEVNDLSNDFDQIDKDLQSL